ncbi:glutamate receptor ionotropic, kainate 2 [Anastrepha ludens]|uniref:glutamate receptor ionotropic, kainate 2 n=1 Tax=Anastrepha ludens TaxID=28586 RepID=UPI0023B0AD2D|nr:glutamate receptor ionotropic, kainate 2 [Anastrepha ludens]
MKISLVHLIFALLCAIAHTADRPQFNVGIIFASRNDDTEIAFLTAIERANVVERSFELVPIVEYANTDDSFIVEKTVCKLIAQGVIAIFGPNTAGGTDIVTNICNTLDIPHIVFDWSPSESLSDREHTSMTLNVHPNNILLSRGMAEILQSFNWRSYTIVYETEKELQQLQDVLQVGEPENNPTTLRQLGEGPDYRPFLKNIKLSSDNCMILHCATENILSVLRQADELKMLGEYQSVFITALDTHTQDFKELLSVSANITTIRLMDPTDYKVKNAAHDWEERENREKRYYRADPSVVKTHMILANDAVAMFAKGLAELDIVEKLSPPKLECRKNRAWPHGKRIIEFLKARPLEGATGRIGFNQHGERNFFTLRFMEFTPNGFLELSTWDPVNGLDSVEKEDASEKRVGEKLSNKTFIITSRIGAPFLLDREPKDGEILQGNARYEGYSMDLIDAIARLLNFKYEFVLAPDGKYGSFNKLTQSWDGLVKQLLDGNADLGICDLTMTSARRQAVDFTPPFMTLGISILYAKPEQQPPDLFSFLSPFSLDVWVYMATAYLGVSLLIFGLSRMAPADWENPHPCKEPEEVENPWCMSNTTWLAVGSIMGQGCDILPKAASTRLVTGMWWFFALMMLNSYTANLAAFLTMSRMESSIKSAEDLATQSKIKYGTLLGGSTMGFFRDSNFTTYQRMWTAMETARPSVFTKNNDEGKDRVLKGKGLYAFLMESTTLEYIIERDCALMQVGGWLDYKTYGIAMPFNSPYRKQISGAVLKLGESGTLSELKRKWWKEMHGGGSCSQAESSSDDTPELDLENVGGVFLVLGIGLLTAILIGMCEFLWNIKAVAIEEKISLSEAFQSELLFALRFWIQTKPVHIASTSSGGSSSSSSSSSKSSKSTKSSSSSSTSSKRSKHSSKSYAHSFSHSSKSVTNDKHDQEKDRLSVHDKLRKISSMFSLKSARSEPSVNNVHLEAQPALKNNAHHPNNHNHATIRKSTQMVREVAQQTTPISDEQSDGEEEKEQQQQQEEVEEQPVEQSEPQPHHHHHHHHHHRHHNHNHNHNHNQQQPDGDQPDMQLIERTQNGKVGRNGYAGFGNAEV